MSTPGGVEGGEIHVDVVADASGLERDLRVKVEEAAKRVRASVQVQADTARANAQIEALRRAAERQVQIQVDIDDARARASLAALGRSQAVAIKVDVDLSDAEAKMAAFRRTQESNKITIKVDADTSAADRAIARLRAAQAGLNRSSSSASGGNSFVTLANNIDRAGSSLLSFGKVAGIGAGIPELVGIVGNLGGAFIALTSAMGPAVNTLALIPAAATAAGQGILALVAGFAAIPGALKAYQQSQQQAAATAATNAKAQESAAERVRSAAASVADAQRAAARQSETSARSISDAQTRLSRAVADGQQQIAQARQRLADARADTGVADALERLAKVEEDARDRIIRAQRDVADARQNAADVAVSSAKAIADAEAAVTTAEDRLKQRQADALAAQQSLTDARKEAKRRLDELTLSVKGSALDEEEASLAVIRAKQQLDKVNRSQAAKPLDKQEADLAYRQALQRLDEVKQRNKELTEDATAAQQAGVEGAANVVAAKANVTQSQQAVTSAQQDVVAAQQNVVAAQQKAARDQADAARKIADAQAAYAKTERDNARDITDAQNALAKARNDYARGITDAQRGLANAQRDYARSVGDAQKDLARAREDATQGAADATRRIADARRSLAAAEKEQADTADKTTAAQRNWEQALKSLSPTAQRFVKFLADQFLPAMREIQKRAQEGLLPGVQKALQTLLPYADDIGNAFHDTAQIIGDLAAAAAKLVTSGPFRRDFRDIATTNDQVIRSFGGAFLNLLDVFRNLVHTGAPFLEQFALAVERATGRLRAATQRKRDDGSLFTMFADAYATAARLGHILKTLGDALFNMGHAARPTGNSLLQGLSDMIDKFDRWTRSPQGQKAMSDFFARAADAVRQLGPPLSKLGDVFSKTTEMNGFATALNGVATALLAISKIPGVEHLFDWALEAAGAALVLGAIAKVLSPIVKGAGLVSGAVNKIRGAGGGGTGGGPTPGGGNDPTTRVQRVTWGPTALPVRIVGGAPGGGGGDPFDPNDPMNQPGGGGGPTPGGGDPGAPLPARPTVRQRLGMRAASARNRINSTRLGGAAGRGITRLTTGRAGTALTSGVGRLTTAAGRGAGALGRAGTATGNFLGRGGGLMGLGVGLAGSLAGNVISGNSAHGSTRAILGGAVSGAASGMGIGAMIGSFVPVIGTGIGAAIGAAIGGIYGAISNGLDVKKIAGQFANVAGSVAKATGGIFADIGHGIVTAWDNSVGKLVSTIHGWWDDIVRGARWLGDQLVFHSIIPDIVNGIIHWFDILTLPIQVLIGFFRDGIPGAANALKGWFSRNWPAIEGIIELPLKLARAFYDTEWGLLRKGFTAVLSWVTAPASWNWGRILDVIEAPVKAVLSWITGRDTGFGSLRGAFTAVLSWVTAPASWNWGKVLSVIRAPVDSAISWIKGASGFGALRGAFNDVKDYVTGAWKREWAGLTKIFTDPIGAARDAIAGSGRTLGGILGGLNSRFGSFVSGAGTVLNGLRGVWAAPIRFVVDTVINRGLLGAFNFLAGKLPGLSKIGPINLPDSLYPRSTAHPGGYATGGILPGYTPGRDVHRFYSPTAGYLDLSGGEGIIRPEATSALGAGWIDGVNAAAMSGGVQGVQSFLGGFAGGGILGALGSAWDSVRGGASKVKHIVTGATDAVGDAAGALAGIISDPIGWFQKKIKGALGDLSQFDNTFLGQAVSAVPRAAADAIIGKISDVFGGLFGGGNGQAGWPVGNAPLGPGFAAAGSHWGNTGGRHTGQDFTVPTGTPVHPAWAGVVQVVKSLVGSYGNYVELQHGGSLHTLYAHLSRILVKVGDTLSPSSVLGLSGASGNVTGPHLHFEVRTGPGTGTPVDPMPYLRGQIGGAAQGAVGAGVSRWAGQVAQALALLGQPQALAGAVNRRMQFESSGNPDIVNTTDSNWKAGHPSVGLLQVIGDTFRAYAGPFLNTGPFKYGVSTNPLANIYAGLNYALHRYGSIGAIDPLVRPRGYDQGGPLYPGYTLSYNGTRDTETVLTGDHTRRLLNLVDRLPDMQARASTTDLVTALRAMTPTQIDVHPAPGMDEVALAKRTAFELEWART